jgi:hypothetical protein
MKIYWLERDTIHKNKCCWALAGDCLEVNAKGNKLCDALSPESRIK